MLPPSSRTHFYGVQAAGGIAGRHINREISVTSVGGRWCGCGSTGKDPENSVDVTAKRLPLMRDRRIERTFEDAKRRYRLWVSVRIRRGLASLAGPVK